MVILVYGVSGSGKSTIGAALAARLQCRFVDADDYHPPANRDKMQHGIPLDDADRAPWLATLRGLIDESLGKENLMVLACSALKALYRHQLGVDETNVRSVMLHGDFDLIAERLAGRSHAFMNKGLLSSQLETLEPGEDGLTLDISADPESICDAIISTFGMNQER